MDANILLYASDAQSPFHERAHGFLDTCMREGSVFCLGWPTVMSYLRIATHPSVFAHPLTPAEAASNIETLIRLPHVRLLSEEEGFWEIYRNVAAQVAARGNLVPDTHLAALLRQHGVRTLYTHDRDFRKFDFLDARDPLS